jgi:transcriptional regulator with XRE-family HTH domain
MARARHVITAFSGERLRQLRREQGVSQEFVGRRMAAAAGDTSDTAVTRERLKVVGYESGEHQPRAEGLHAVAAALGVPATALLDPDAPVTLELLRALRQLTQGQVAQQLGISQARYSQLENGQGRLDPGRRETLAGLLQVTPDDLDRLLPGPPQDNP